VKQSSICCIFFLSLVLYSCGGGGGGSSSQERAGDHAVRFNVIGDDSDDLGMGSSRNLEATVFMRDGRTPLPGIEVRFSFLKNQSGAVLEVINNETSAHGTAQAFYRAGNRSGNDIIELKATRTRALASFRIGGEGEIVDMILIAADPDEVNTKGTSLITIEGKFHNAMPAAGSLVEIFFVENQSNAEFIHGVQSMERISLYLDNQGKAGLTYRAGDTPGKDSIMAIFP